MKASGFFLKSAGLILIILKSASSSAIVSDTITVNSPSSNISVRVWMGNQLTWDVWSGGKQIMKPSFIDLIPEGKGSLAASGKIKSSDRKEFRGEIVSPVPEKRKIIPDNYNLLTLLFRVPYKVEFRVYDDGIGYRILTQFRDSLTIKNEVARFSFPGNSIAFFPLIHKRADADIFHTSFEEEYPRMKLDSIPEGAIAYSPVLVINQGYPDIAITESDLEDYPGMFLGGTGTNNLTGVFAGYPLEEKTTEGTYPQYLVTQRAPYIARTMGTRSFPWRCVIITAGDMNLPSNDLVYRLGSPSRIADPSWINPGNLTDEWIIDLNLFNVPFRAGLNTDSYKYYIDFAKRFGFERIMMDAGWSDNRDLFRITPAINVDSLVAYAKKRGVKLSMWALSMALDRQLDSALARFEKWGIDFIMTDFIDRDDQKAVNFYHRIAAACAKRRIMIMYHGAFPPKGFNRTWPNAVAREGVLGSEYNIWSSRVTPGHDVTLPFTRMLAGGLDYEPGLLDNATIKFRRPVEGAVYSPGTRCHQLAMFIVYDSPMQIFSGNPSEGMREPEFMNIVGHLPTTWDETRILSGKAGEYIVTARQKGDDWYIGGMTDWNARDIDLKLDFLGPGTYKAVICRDGVNADRYAADYVIENGVVVSKDYNLKLHLAPGGGFIIILRKYWDRLSGF